MLVKISNGSVAKLKRPSPSPYPYPSPAMCLSHCGSFTLQETDSGTDADSNPIPVVGS